MGVFVKTADEWVNLETGASGGELPGLGGWADVTTVTGTGTKYSYNADDMDWSAFEWTSDGDVTAAGGLIEALVVGGGGSNSNWYANSGGAEENLLQVNGSYDIVVGYGGGVTMGSRIGSSDPEAQQLLACTKTVYGSGNTYPSNQTSNNGIYKGTISHLTGVEIEYARGAYPADQSNTPGSAINITVNPTANDGVVVIRVPEVHDKTGLPAGAFDTTTLRDKAKSAAKEAVKTKRKTKK